MAITDRLAFIATKDGRAWNRPDLSLLDDSDGWLNITAGFKYALIQRPDDRFILSPALRVELPVGSEDVYSGGGGVLSVQR